MSSKKVKTKVAGVRQICDENGATRKYEITVSNGYVNGKQQKKSNVVEVPENIKKAKDIEEWLLQQKLDLKKAIRAREYKKPEEDFCFGELARQMISVKHNLKHGGVDWYIPLTERIEADDLGKIKVTEIKDTHISDFIKRLKTDSRRDCHYQAKIDFRELLKSSNMSIAAVSRKANVSTKTVSSLLKGNNLIEETSRKLCDALEISFEESFEKVNKKGLEDVVGLAASTIKKYHSFYK